MNEDYSEEIILYKKERVATLNQLYRRLNEIDSIRFNLLIYRLVKKGFVSVTDLASCAGLTPNRIYQIINKFDQEDWDEEENDTGDEGDAT